MDVAVTLKDEKDKLIIIIRNYAYIDNDKSKLILWLG